MHNAFPGTEEAKKKRGTKGGRERDEEEEEEEEQEEEVEERNEEEGRSTRRGGKARMRARASVRELAGRCVGHNALRDFLPPPCPAVSRAPVFSLSSAPLDLFFVLVLIVLDVPPPLLLVVVVGTRRDSLWKAHGILLLVYMESTREARRACTMQMIPRYGLFIVSHLRVYMRWIYGRARAIRYYIIASKAQTRVAIDSKKSPIDLEVASASSTPPGNSRRCIRYSDDAIAASLRNRAHNRDMLRLDGKIGRAHV